MQFYVPLQTTKIKAFVHILVVSGFSKYIPLFSAGWNFGKSHRKFGDSSQKLVTISTLNVNKTDIGGTRREAFSLASTKPRPRQSCSESEALYHGRYKKLQPHFFSELSSCLHVFIFIFHQKIFEAVYTKLEEKSHSAARSKVKISAKLVTKQNKTPN